MEKWNVEKGLKNGGGMEVTPGLKFAETVGIGGRLVLAAVLGNVEEKALGVDAWASGLARESAERAEKTSEGASIPDRELVKLFCAVGTAVWKLEGRMLDAETGEAKEGYRRVWRHVEAIKDALAGIGVETIDWTGKRYDEGMSLKVVSEEERAGVKEPEIVETLLPTIRFRQRVQLQQGEVVVSRPVQCVNGA